VKVWYPKFRDEDEQVTGDEGIRDRLRDLGRGRAPLSQDAFDRAIRRRVGEGQAGDVAEMKPAMELFQHSVLEVPGKEDAYGGVLIDAETEPDSEYIRPIDKGLIKKVSIALCKAGLKYLLETCLAYSRIQIHTLRKQVPLNFTRSTNHLFMEEDTFRTEVFLPDYQRDNMMYAYGLLSKRYNPAERINEVEANSRYNRLYKKVFSGRNRDAIRRRIEELESWSVKDPEFVRGEAEKMQKILSFSFTRDIGMGMSDFIKYKAQYDDTARILLHRMRQLMEARDKSRKYGLYFYDNIKLLLDARSAQYGGSNMTRPDGSRITLSYAESEKIKDYFGEIFALFIQGEESFLHAIGMRLTDDEKKWVEDLIGYLEAEHEKHGNAYFLDKTKVTIDGMNTTFGDICGFEEHHPVFEGLDRKIEKMFRSLGREVGAEDRSLTQAETDAALALLDKVEDGELSGIRDDVRRFLRKKVRGDIPDNVKIFFIPSDEEEPYLWEVDGKFGAAHFSVKNNSIYINLGFLRFLQERLSGEKLLDAIHALALHEGRHILGTSHDEALKETRVISSEVDALFLRAKFEQDSFKRSHENAGAADDESVVYRNNGPGTPGYQENGEVLRTVLNEYVDANQEFLGKMLGEGKKLVLLRLPVEILFAIRKVIGRDNLELFLSALQGIPYLEKPNTIIELFSTSDKFSVTDATYEDLHIKKQKFTETRTRTNTLTLFLTDKDEKIESQYDLMKKVDGDYGLKLTDTIVMPIGKYEKGKDLSGLVRSIVLGLRIMQIARNEEAGISDQVFIEETLTQFESLCKYTTNEDYTIEVEDLMNLATGNIRKILTSIRKIIKLLPIIPIDAEELKSIYKHAREVLIAA